MRRVPRSPRRLQQPSRAPSRWPTVRSAAATFRRPRRCASATTRQATTPLGYPLPAVQVRIDRDSSAPGVVFTWKVESGEAPYIILRVPPNWLRDVVRPGHVVLDGQPVMEVLDRDPDGRPARVLAVAIGGGYDSSLHGWRAHGAASLVTATWDPGGQPHIVG